MSSCSQSMQSSRTSGSKSGSTSSASKGSSSSFFSDSLMDETRKLKRLQRDGIIILIDHPNLEIGTREKLKETGERRNWHISYATLIKTISNGSNKLCRRVLATHLVTSNQALQYFRPSDCYRHRHRIKLAPPPDERNKGQEKALDCTLTRIMTQEFEGIEILRLMGKQPPKRTFCIVSGDFDFVDAVLEARKVGCDVEIWYWERLEAFSKQWRRQEVKTKCDSERCGNFMIVDLEDQEDFLGELVRYSPIRSSQDSASKNGKTA